MAGEIVVYDPDEVYDYARFKCGDGVTNINSLPFIFKIDENYATKEYVNDAVANVDSIIDVTELPTTDVDRNIIHRLPGVGKTPELFYVNADGELQPYLGIFNAVMGFASDDGSGTPFIPFSSVNCILVDELPEDAESLNIYGGGVVPIYIVKTTGVGYVRLSSGSWHSAGQAVFGKADCGWSENISEETAEGVYAVNTEFEPSTYNIFDGRNWATLLSGTDKTLSKDGKAADAKTVGEIVSILYTDAEIWMCESSEEVFNLGEYVKLGGGKINVKLVDELPTILEPSSESTMTINAYVVNSTGIAYVDFDGQGVMTAGELLTGMSGYDHGWSADINSETIPGFYCVRKLADIKKLNHTVNGLFETIPGEVTHVGDTITWDGDINNFDGVVLHGSNELGEIFEVKVSNSIPTVEEIGSETEFSYVYKTPDETKDLTSSVISIGQAEEGMIDLRSDGFIHVKIVSSTSAVSSIGQPYPETGVYFTGIKMSNGISLITTSLTIPGYNFIIQEPGKKVIKSELIPVDATLTQAGKAADAKAVGEAIANFNIVYEVNSAGVLYPTFDNTSWIGMQGDSLLVQQASDATQNNNLLEVL